MGSGEEGFGIGSILCGVVCCDVMWVWTGCVVQSTGFSWSLDGLNGLVLGQERRDGVDVYVCGCASSITLRDRH